MPDLSEDIELQQVQLKLWMIPLMPEEAISVLKYFYGSAYDELSHHEQLSLATALLEGEISNSRMQEITELHRTDIGLLLSGLVKKEMLLPTGYGRGMKYRIKEEFKDQGGDEVKRGGDQVGDEVIRDGGQSGDQVIQNNMKDNIQEQILALINEDNKITQQELADKIGCSKRTIERNMVKMVSVKFVGSGYSGHWEIQ